MLKLMYITNNTEVAQIAQKNGVDRIWIDLETKGKEQRQLGMNTVKSHHSIEDIKRIRPYVTESELMVRINPWNSESEEEIDRVIEAGADIIMLPMWRTEGEVYSFINKVNQRVRTILLLETQDAEKCLEKVLHTGGMDEIHIGLNDLHLEYGLSFMFELLANGTVERICKKISEAGIPYGFGGVGKIGEGLLKADSIVAEHYRLGSSMVILSRSFCNTEEIRDMDKISEAFETNIRNLRLFEKKVFMEYTAEDYEMNRIQITKAVEKIVGKLKERQAV